MRKEISKKRKKQTKTQNKLLEAGLRVYSLDFSVLLILSHHVFSDVPTPDLCFPSQMFLVAKYPSLHCIDLLSFESDLDLG